MTRSRPAVLLSLAALLLAGCAATEAELPPLPQRTVLYYDYVGAWAVTAGNACEERVDLSRGVFLAVAPDPSGRRGRFYAEYFFMLDPEDKAEAEIGEIAADGSLVLGVEAEGMVDGRRAVVAYRLRLEPRDASHVLVRRFDMATRDPSGQENDLPWVDLLRDPALASDVPVLAVAGPEGLCLRRL